MSVRDQREGRDGSGKETRSKLSFPSGMDVHNRRPRQPVLRDPLPDQGVRGGKTLALTFDDGPSEYTGDILDILEEHGAKASFFVLGDYIGGDYLKRMVESGCEVCNHTTTHPNLQYLNAVEALHELAACSTRIVAATGQAPYFYRAPFGKDSPEARAAGLTCGMVSVGWDVDAEDWAETDSKIIASRILDGVTAGARVILLHDGVPPDRIGTRQPTVDAVRVLVPTLLSQGYELVTVSELYGREGACSEDVAISAS